MAVVISWETINLTSEMVLAVNFAPKANFIEIEKITGFSALQKTNDVLLKPTISVRFDYNYCNPLALYNTLISKQMSLTFAPLLIGKRNFGSFVLNNIDVNLTEIDDAGNWLRLDLTLEFLMYRG